MIQLPPTTPTNPLCSLPSLFTPETKPLNHQQAAPRAPAAPAHAPPLTRTRFPPLAGSASGGYAPPPPMPPAGGGASVWEEHETDYGQVYYFNTLTNETAWEPPPELQQC